MDEQRSYWSLADACWGTDREVMLPYTCLERELMATPSCGSRTARRNCMNTLINQDLAASGATTTVFGGTPPSKTTTMFLFGPGKVQHLDRLRAPTLLQLDCDRDW